MTTRRLIIQWSQKILIIDIIISWKLLWDQRPQTIGILHEWNTETPHFQSKRVLVPELLTCSCEDRLPNCLIQITRIDQTLPILTHWGRATHICVSNVTIIGSDNSLSSGRHQAIIYTNAGILSIGPLGTNFNEISIGIQTLSFKKTHFKMGSAKWRPFCLGLNVLIQSTPFLYARLKNGRIMLWQCPSVRPSVRPSFPDFFSTCFEISIWNLVYAFSRWHDMSSLSFITIGSLWPSLQPKVGQTQFLQLWPYKSR